MEGDKSPGPDRFTMLFYQECWEIIRNDLFKVFESFFERVTINKGVNATFLVHIPKNEEATELFYYRPINLVCSLYKIIAKVLSLRLRDVKDKVISNSKVAFIKSRQIMDSILVANECVDGGKK